MSDSLLFHFLVIMLSEVWNAEPSPEGTFSHLSQVLIKLHLKEIVHQPTCLNVLRGLAVIEADSGVFTSHKRFDLPDR